MEPVHLGLGVLIAILAFAVAINHFDRRIQSNDSRRQTEKETPVRRDGAQSWPPCPACKPYPVPFGSLHGLTFSRRPS